MVGAILIVSVIIVLIVLFLSVITTSKAYTSVQHTVDPVEGNPHLKHKEDDLETKKTRTED
ncbi:YtzI protein [Bacillus fonticola]|uniref:YtzI protein n=1 Tax=Bacillus fonticola TaxID=2728853 RepID=UPI001474FAA2|nr:YtzI protein [Bacillus fonticola]